MPVTGYVYDGLPELLILNLAIWKHNDSHSFFFFFFLQLLHNLRFSKEIKVLEVVPKD